MSKGRHQQGYLYKRNGSWMLRYYEDEVRPDGSVVRVQRARKLASVREYPTKSEARSLADEFLSPLNSGRHTVEGTMRIDHFVEQYYFPHVAERNKDSTVAEYRRMFNTYVKARIGRSRLRDFKTIDAQLLMNEIARTYEHSRDTLKHIKSLLSGIFKHAKRLGFINHENPIRDVELPKGKQAKETYAYSLEEVQRMLAVLPQDAAVVVAVAAFTGLRKGEIRGLSWQDYDGDTIRVNQSIVRGKASDPKTAKSRAAVPVIAPLRKWLDDCRIRHGNVADGLIFKSQVGTSLDLDTYVKRVIKPALKRAGLPWHGWHAFRRGLATNLYHLGAPDKTIQSVLRHSQISVTMNIYVKSIPEDTRDAMKRLELSCTNCAPASASTISTEPARVM